MTMVVLTNDLYEQVKILIGKQTDKWVIREIIDEFIWELSDDVLLAWLVTHPTIIGRKFWGEPGESTAIRYIIIHHLIISILYRIKDDSK